MWRGGLSNGVLFVPREELIIVDMRARAAIVAGVVAGLTSSSACAAYGYGDEVLFQQLEGMLGAAKAVVRIPITQLKRIELSRNVNANETSIESDNFRWRASLMNREQSDQVSTHGPMGFAERFVDSTSRIYSVFERVAPVLVR